MTEYLYTHIIYAELPNFLSHFCLERCYAGE